MPLVVYLKFLVSITQLYTFILAGISKFAFMYFKVEETALMVNFLMCHKVKPGSRLNSHLSHH